MFSYATKVDLKGATVVDMSNLASKLNLGILKAAVSKIDVGKLKIVPVNLSNPSNIVNNEVVKKTVYDKLVAKGNSNSSKVNNIDTSEFILETNYGTDKSDLEKKSIPWQKIPDASGIIKSNKIINAKILK